MKKRYKTKIAVEVLGNLLLGVVLLTTILVYTPALAQLRDYNPQGLEATTLEEVLALRDEEIDLATAIMILYREWDPSFDATGPLQEIDRMALQLELRISPGDSPERTVNLINRYLLRENAYFGTSLDPADPEKLQKSAVLCLVGNKEGNCLGLSLLYLALGERLGLPFYGVAAPEHVFVRYDDGAKRINVDTTEKGREYKDSHYEKNFMLHSTYGDYDFYLRSLTKREIIGLFLSNLGIAYYEKGMYDQAIARYRKAVEISPNHPEAHFTLGYQSKPIWGGCTCRLSGWGRLLPLRAL